MDTLIQIAQLILCLSILVILHELGHFLPAKWFKTRVDKFYLFFDPWFSLVKKKIGETEYGIGWLPLGGYVKIAGMIDESMDKEQLKQPPQPWEYRSKKPWQKLIIILGGITVNVLLSWFIYTVVFSTYGHNYISTSEFQKEGLSFNQAAEKAGFKDGDKIVSIDGKTVNKNFNHATIDILLADNVTVERNGSEKEIQFNDAKIKSILNGARNGLIQPLVKNVVVDSIIPNSDAEKAGLQKGDALKSIDGKSIASFNAFVKTLDKYKNDSILLNVERNGTFIDKKVKVSDSATLGFAPRITNFEVNNKLTFGEAIPYAWNHMITMLKYQIKQVKLVIRPETEAYKHVSGPLRLFKAFSTEWNWELFWNFTAMLSIWLAFINLLPIPGLDGGHAVFIILEMITGKQASEKTMEVAQTIGFVIVMGLMVVVFGNDIWNLIQENFN